MNLLESTDDVVSDILFANFNQDCSSITVATKKGYKFYSLSKINELQVIHESTEEVRIVERLFSSSLIAIVTSAAPRKLKVCHFKKGTEICNYSYSNTILAVKLNKMRLVVCLQESLYIHNIRDMKVLHTIRDTPPNPNGLCALSTNNDINFLVFPASSAIGEVQIFDAGNLQPKSMIPAHDNPLAAMAFNPSGTKLATASEKGTVIRVFNVLDGSKLYEFRRGVKRCVRIYSLCFSEDSMFLSASSNTETVHIFKLDELKDVKPPEEPQSWLGYFGKAIIQSASYLPTQVADMFYQGRSFASVHLPFAPSAGVRNICALNKVEQIPRVMVFSGQGFLYIHDLEPLEGGDCNLVRSVNLLGPDDEPSERPNGQYDPNAIEIEHVPRRILNTGGASYAEIVRGADAGLVQEMESEVYFLEQEMEKVVNVHRRIQNDYENQFPPMAQKSEA